MGACGLDACNYSGCQYADDLRSPCYKGGGEGMTDAEAEAIIKQRECAQLKKDIEWLEGYTNPAFEIEDYASIQNICAAAKEKLVRMLAEKEAPEVEVEFSRGQQTALDMLKELRSADYGAEYQQKLEEAITKLEAKVRKG